VNVSRQKENAEQKQSDTPGHSEMPGPVEAELRKVRKKQMTLREFSSLRRVIFFFYLTIVVFHD